jgi:cytochrome b
MIAGGSGSLKVWDGATRLFHWTLAALVVLSWASAQFRDVIADVTMRWHRASGYALLILLVWRILWGFSGPEIVRFSKFLRPPADAERYARELSSGVARRYLGHNPLGGYMVAGLIVIVLAQALLGLFVVEHDDLANGPLSFLVPEELSRTVRRWHHTIFNFAVLPLVFVHVLANVFYQVIKGEPLIRAMLTGSKPAVDYADAHLAPKMQPTPFRAIILLLISAGGVLGPIWAVAGKL